jgi:hypothetical protein
VVAVLLAIVAVAGAAVADFQRRRKQAMLIHQHREEAKEHKVEFTRRDRKTLTSDKRP